MTLARASNTTYMFSQQIDGNHTVAVKAFDRVGLTKEESASFIVNTSLIGGPGWTDDIIVFGSVATAAVIVSSGIYFWRRKKSRIPPLLHNLGMPSTPKRDIGTRFLT